MGLRHLIHTTIAAWMSRYHGISGLGALSRAFPFEVGSLDFVTHADKRHGRNRARDNRPRKIQNVHLCMHTGQLCYRNAVTDQ